MNCEVPRRWSSGRRVSCLKSSQGSGPSESMSCYFHLFIYLRLCEGQEIRHASPTGFWNLKKDLFLSWLWHEPAFILQECVAQVAWPLGHFLEDCGLGGIGPSQPWKLRRCHVSWIQLLAQGCMESGSSAVESQPGKGSHSDESISPPLEYWGEQYHAAWKLMKDSSRLQNLWATELNSLPFTQVLLKHLGAEVRGFWLPVVVGCWDIGPLRSDRFQHVGRGQEGKLRKHHINHYNFLPFILIHHSDVWYHITNPIIFIKYPSTSQLWTNHIHHSYYISSGNQTWQSKMDHL